MSEAYKNAQVVTSDGKNIGTVKSSDSSSLIVFKKGVIKDEEFHIPIVAISHYNRRSGDVREDNNSIPNIILNVSEEEVKHGFEFIGDSKPNSNLISGKSNSGYKIGKETIRYEAFMPDSDKNVNPASSTDKLPPKQEYICDMCMQKFYDSNELQDHRKAVHSAAIGI
jgi:hypothetical protein